MPCYFDPVSSTTAPEPYHTNGSPPSQITNLPPTANQTVTNQLSATWLSTMQSRHRLRCITVPNDMTSQKPRQEMSLLLHRTAAQLSYIVTPPPSLTVPQIQMTCLPGVLGGGSDVSGNDRLVVLKLFQQCRYPYSVIISTVPCLYSTTSISYHILERTMSLQCQHLYSIMPLQCQHPYRSNIQTVSNITKPASQPFHQSTKVPTVPTVTPKYQSTNQPCLPTFPTISRSNYSIKVL